MRAACSTTNRQPDRCRRYPGRAGTGPRAARGVFDTVRTGAPSSGTRLAGRDARPRISAVGIPGDDRGVGSSSISPAEMPRRVDALLERCPSWLDSSPLTFDLAEEILLRQGRLSADPTRDAGAYRFLFEHRLAHRLELYRRMLLWMAWLWKCSAQPELSASALALQSQLSDEQYAVPSHPFMVGLTTRSLMAAQQFFGTSVDGPSRPRESPETRTG